MNLFENEAGFGSGKAKFCVGRECGARVALPADTGNWGIDILGA